MSTAIDESTPQKLTDRASVVLPDKAPCAECRRELFDAASRRFRYPFLTCADCGPRFGILRETPFVRDASTMAEFEPCERCRRERGADRGRQRGNETIACPDCGPTLAARDGDGQIRAHGEQALEAAVAFLAEGGVLAVEGYGGYSLVANANDAAAVKRIRRTDERPLAVLFATVAQIEAICEVSELERQAIESSAAPIVLLRRRDDEDEEVPRACSGAPGSVFPARRRYT
jgi:hydrogenase maturation protein HypF